MVGPALTVVSVDLDLVDWAGSQAMSEAEITDAVPVLRHVLSGVPGGRTTWFVRIDDGVAHHFGDAAHMLRAHGALLDGLRSDGHELGWHHHAVAADGVTPEATPARRAAALRRHGPTARAAGFEVARMGWGQHGPEEMAVLASLGFAADASAMPRPRYPWDVPGRDWDGAPDVPYTPSAADPRRPANGADALGIRVVPMRMVPLPAAGDTQPDVRRYVNLAYHADRFRDAIAACPADAPLVVLVHPYEVLGGRHHPLLAFSADVAAANLAWLAAQRPVFGTIGDLAVAASSALVS